MFVSVNHWLKPQVLHCRFGLLSACPANDWGVTIKTSTFCVAVSPAGFLEVKVTATEPAASGAGTALSVQFPAPSEFKKRFELDNSPSSEEPTLKVTVEGGKMLSITVKGRIENVPAGMAHVSGSDICGAGR